MATIGTGDFTYEVVDNWAKLPEGWTIGQAEPACDSQDRVYIFNRSDHPRMVFDREGNFLHQWGKEYLTDAHGIWVHWDGRVMVCDRENNRIQLFTGDGEYLGMWTHLARPCDIYVDADGIVYVVELDAFMTILNMDGEVLAKMDIGGAGGHAVWADSHGDLYIGHNQEGRRLVKLVRQQA